MAAAVHQPRADNVPSGLSLYPHTLALTDFDFKDNPYTPLTPPMQNYHSTGVMTPNTSRGDVSNSGDARERRWNPQPVASRCDTEERMRNDTGVGGRVEAFDNQHATQPKQDSVVSYALPAGARRVVERYSLVDGLQRVSSRNSDTKPPAYDSNISTPERYIPQSVGNRNDARDQTPPLAPSPSRHLPSPGVGMGARPSNDTTFPSVVMSQTFNPSLGIPISPKPRAYALHPTYITPPSAPHPVNPIFSPPPVPPEEVCVECAMRDQDMADVDVSSPGVWDRESDALYEDLLHREHAETTAGIPNLDPTRPKARGGQLTEQNLKLWLSINPREPASRQQTLETYVRSQRKLLEAEAMAHARAMQEAKQLDNRMRDTYSQLRRSAYDMGSAATVADDSGGVRIKPPPYQSMSHTHGRSQSREVTLLENGMIVEHVDMRKEEREARERKRKEEKRARKVSRSSGMDVTSLYSESLVPHADSQGLKPSSRYSQASSARPTSVLTAPVGRSNIPRAYSQASFSDVQSVGSASPRRSRFFGLNNLSASWRSQDSLAQSGVSGSMVNMHVALQREAYANPLTQSPVDMGGHASERNRLWPPVDPDAELQQAHSHEKLKKRKNGLAKIWRIVTGSSKTYPPANGQVLPSYERNEDDLPLAPPPPLSYLVERGPGDVAVTRHGSTTSLHSITSPKNALSSPVTSPSTVLPSPISSRRSGVDRDIVIEGRPQHGICEDPDQHEPLVDESDKLTNSRSFRPVISEPDIRPQASHSDPSHVCNPVNAFSASVMSREKSLPPLPDEIPGPRDAAHVDRPQTMFTYEPRQMPLSSTEFLPPLAPFRTSEPRRQSFGGMASPPNVATQMVQTVPSRRGAYNLHDTLGPSYDEFGSSRRSLGRLEYVQEDTPTQRVSTPTAKRKSKFGFALLLGRKHEKPTHDGEPHEFPTPSRSGSDQRGDYIRESGHARSISRQSALSGLGPRMSTTSRKTIDELVSQDAEFVAYRYPSNDQRLDILR